VPFLDRTLARALRPYVASMVAYAVTLDSPRLHRGLPTTGLTFVLPVGEPLDVGWAGQALTRQKRWSCVSGLHTQPAEIFCGVADRGIQLSLTTLGARALLGLPAAALAAEILSLDDVAPWLAQLPERLAEVHGWPQRLAVAEQELLAALARHGDPVVRPEIGAALARLVDGGGVQEVADEVGYSRRHLGNLVREECGVGPQGVPATRAVRAGAAGAGDRCPPRPADRCGSCRVRVRRPGSPGARVERTRGLPAVDVVGRGVPKPSSRRGRRRGTLSG
jgi:hypothetical protein